MAITVCPIAIVVGCKKCPAYSFCPLKTVIGDEPKPDKSPPASSAGKTTKPKQ